MAFNKFIEQVRNTSLTKGRELFLELINKKKPDQVDLKKTVQAIYKKADPFLGRIVRIEIMSSILNQCREDRELHQQQLYDLFNETYFLMEGIGHKEGLEILSQIRRKYPRALRVLDYPAGWA